MNTLHALSEPFAWLLLHALWQGAALALLLALTLPLVRPPHLRHTLACITLLAMLLVPIATLALTTSATSPPPARTATTHSPATALPLPAAPVEITTPDLAIRAPAPQPTPSFRTHALTALPLAYLLGVSLASLRFLRAAIIIRRLTAHTTPAPQEWQDRLNALAAQLALTRPVRLLVSSLADVPAVLGALRPVILIPAGALTGLSPTHLEALLAHELAHIRRHDFLLNLLQCILETLLFFHPAAWWVSARIRQEREHACDDLAAALVGSPTRYAHALVAMEEHRSPSILIPAVADGSLHKRIRRLLAPTPPRRALARMSPAPRAVAAICILTATALLLSTAYLPACSRQDTPPATKPATKRAVAGNTDNTVVRVYDVRDVIVSRLPLTLDGKRQPPAETQQEAVERILTLLKENVAADSWNREHVSKVTIRVLNGQLIVSQSPEVHEQVRSFLESIRKLYGQQVTFEVRFIQVDRGTCARMAKARGFDIKVPDSRHFAKARPSWGPNLILSGEGGIRASVDASAVDTVPIKTSDVGEFLRNLQEQGATMLTAPRITLFNGSSAEVTFTHGFVTPPSEDGTVPRSVETLSMSIAPIVSADQKSISMEFGVEQHFKYDRKHREEGSCDVPTFTNVISNAQLTIADDTWLLVPVAGNINRPVLSFDKPANAKLNQPILIALIHPTLLKPGESPTTFPATTYPTPLFDAP